MRIIYPYGLWSYGWNAVRVKAFPWYGYLYVFVCLLACGKQNYMCRKQDEVSKFVHVVCDLRNMAMCRRNLQLKLLKAMVEENDVLNELYGVIIMRKIQLSKRKHRFWIHNIIKKRKRFGVFYHLVKELQLDQNKYMEYFRMSSQQIELVLGFVGPFISKQYRESIDAKHRLAICIRYVQLLF